MKRLIATLVGWLALSATAPAGPAIAPQDRVLVLAPHPDDEVIGCGGIIQQALATGAAVRVVFLTFGDNNELSFMLYRRHPVFLPGSAQKMGLVRRQESISADASLGLAPTNLVFLGYPDFGTLAIWERHWGDSKSYRSLLSRKASVVYADAWRPGAAHKGEDILRDVKDVIRQFKPTKIFTSHPADFNRDHRALYLFTRVAMWDLQLDARVQLYPYLVHHPTWPWPRGLRTDDPLMPPSSLAGDVAWISWPLSREQAVRKLAAMECHRSQYAYSSSLLNSFVRPNELFGDFIGEAADKAPVEESGDALAGIEDRWARVEGEDLIVTLRLSRLLGEHVRASVLAFGYRRDRAFADMPKLHVAMTVTGHAVFDQSQRLRSSEVTVTRNQRDILVKIPLSELGRPGRILTTAQTSTDKKHVDGVTWRIVEVRGERE